MSHVEAVRAVVRMSRLLERTCEDLSLAQYRVLAAVADGEERASHVAARLALGKPTVSASVDALSRRGLITRETEPEDQRVAALKLTPAGTALLAETERAMLARLDEVLAHSEQSKQIVAALVRLGSGLDALAAQRLAGKAR